MKSIEEINNMMFSVLPNNRFRWCENHICACMGCVNVSSGLSQILSKEEWQSWVSFQYSLNDQRTKLSIEELKNIAGNNQLSLKTRLLIKRKKIQKTSVELILEDADLMKLLPPLPYLSWGEVFNEIDNSSMWLN